MLQAFYAKISGPVNAMGSDYFTDLTAKLKSDATYFSIADGWYITYLTLCIVILFDFLYNEIIL